MTVKTEKYSGDELFHAESCDNNPTTIHFIFLLIYKVEATQVLNGLPCVFYEELLINRNNFVT